MPGVAPNGHQPRGRGDAHEIGLGLNEVQEAPVEGVEGGDEPWDVGEEDLMPFLTLIW